MNLQIKQNPKIQTLSQKVMNLLFSIEMPEIKFKVYRTSKTPPRTGEKGFVRLYDEGLNCFDVVKFSAYYPNIGFLYFKDGKLMSSPANVGRIWFTDGLQF